MNGKNSLIRGAQTSGQGSDIKITFLQQTRLLKQCNPFYIKLINQKQGLNTNGKTLGVYEKKYGENYKLIYSFVKIINYCSINGYKKTLVKRY